MAFVALIVPITLIVLLIANLVNMKQRKIHNNIQYLILFVFSLAQFIMVYPISDDIHFRIAALPTVMVVLYYICKSIQEIKNIKVSIFIEHFMNIITISFIGLLILESITIYIYMHHRINQY